MDKATQTVAKPGLGRLRLVRLEGNCASWIAPITRDDSLRLPPSATDTSQVQNWDKVSKGGLKSALYGADFATSDYRIAKSIWFTFSSRLLRWYRNGLIKKILLRKCHIWWFEFWWKLVEYLRSKILKEGLNTHSWHVICVIQLCGWREDEQQSEEI